MRWGHLSARHRRLLAVIGLLALAAPCAGHADILTATIQFGGDVLIHQPLLDDAYDEAGDTYDFTHMLEPVSDLLAQTDLTVLNLEVPIAKGRYGGYPQFNSPPTLLDALAATGTDVLLCANNHALDRLGKGARQTLDAIDAAGLAHVGTARNREEYNAVPLFDLNGISIAIFNYTQHTNGMEKEDTEENLRYAVHYFAVHRAERDVQAAREAGADYVILCVHWGREYEREPTQGVRDWAQALCDAGADLIIGGHPHVMQPMERLVSADGTHETHVLYSMGNFLSGQREQYRDTGALFRFMLEKDTQSGRTETNGHGYIPTWVWLREDIGRYQTLALERAMREPPEGMSNDAVERMQTAWEETVSHMGDDIISASAYEGETFDLTLLEEVQGGLWNDLDGALSDLAE